MAVTQEQREKNMKFTNAYMGVVIGIIAAYFLGYIGSMMSYESIDITAGVSRMIENLKELQLLYPFNTGMILGILGGVGLGFFAWFVLEIDYQKHNAYNAKEIAGTGGFMSDKEKKAYDQKYHVETEKGVEGKLPPMIMSKHFFRPAVASDIPGNNNVLVVGGSGSGKTWRFVKPNILQMNSSFIITDPSGDVLNKVGTTLVNNGYKIKIFNITDFAHSNCYNPLEYIRDEAGVNMVIQCFINNTTIGEGGGENQFFVDAEKLLYSACIYYLKDFCTDKSKKNFANIVNMVNASEVNESDPKAQSKLDQLFAGLPKQSLAAKYYRAFKQAAGRTLKSIIVSCMTRLQPFMTPQIVDLTSSDSLELTKFGDEKMALFIITPQMDRTYSFLASMLYSQAFETLYHMGEEREAKGLGVASKIPIRFLMDEFANIGEVPEFSAKLATVRRYNLSITMILQDISQLEAMYKDDWRSLVGNCSTRVFLGSPEPNTLQYFSDMLGKKTIRTKGRSSSKGKGSSSENFSDTGREVMTAEELGRLGEEKNYCIVFTQDMRPYLDEKYDCSKHPNFDQTGDKNKDLEFHYKEISLYNTVSQNIDMGSITKAEMAFSRAKFLRKEKAKAKKANNVKEDAMKLYNSIELNPTEEKKAIESYSEACVLAAANEIDKNISIFKIKNIQPKYLYKLADYTIATLGLSAVIVFDEVNLPGYEDMMIGIAVDKTEARNLADIMECATGSKGIDLYRKGYIGTVIDKACYEAYKNMVMKAA